MFFQNARSTFCWSTFFFRNLPRMLVSEQRKSHIFSMVVSVFFPKTWDRWHIIPQLAVYTTYILPSGGLYNPYHLLGEPVQQPLIFVDVFIVPLLGLGHLLLRGQLTVHDFVESKAYDNGRNGGLVVTSKWGKGWIFCSRNDFRCLFQMG